MAAMLLAAPLASAATPDISIYAGGQRYFSPNGDGQEDTATVYYCLTEPANVTITVDDTTGTIVRTLEDGVSQPGGSGCSGYNNQFTWDGTGDSGAVVPDGLYTVHVHAVDSGGLTGDGSTQLGVDTRTPGVLTEPASGATVTGSVGWVFTPTSGFPVSSVSVYCSGGSGSSTAESPAADGTFDGSLDMTGCTNGANGVVAVASWIDGFGVTHSWTSPAAPVSVENAPQVSILQGGDRYFSPNGDGQEDTATVYLCLSQDASVDVTVTNASGATVRTIESGVATNGYPAYCYDSTYFTWDGTGDSGAVVPDGLYTVHVHAVDSGGLTGDGSTQLGVDTRTPGVLTEPTSGATLAGLARFVFTPTPGFPLTQVSLGFDTGGSSEIYNASPDGSWRTSMYTGTLTNGPANLYTTVYWTDALGATHSWTGPATPVTIDVTNLPLTFSADQTTGQAPLSTTFHIDTSDPDAQTVHYTLDFGDGTTTSGDIAAPYPTVDVPHTYETPGAYRAIATVTDAAGAASTSSVDVTASAPPDPPSNTAPPSVSGTPQQGQTLTEQHGTWTNEPSSFAVQWERCDVNGANCKPITGATSPTYIVAAADVGDTIVAAETASNASGPSQPAASAPTATIEPPAPANTAPPSISGTAEQAQSLTEAHGTWQNAPTSHGYQWLRCDASGGGCAEIPGAVGQTYVPVDADVGHTLEVSESATNSGGSGPPATSEPTGVVTAAPLAAVAGEDLRATVGVPVAFDGSASTPSNAIERYVWAFGDGSSGTGATVRHAYAAPGTYTATLTVMRGSESATDQLSVTVSPAPAQGTEITVQDTSGAAVGNADVVYVGADGRRISAVTDVAGVAELDGLPDGSLTFYAWTTGYQPATGHVNVTGGVGAATVTLSGGAIATTTLDSQELTLQQIQQAGIDTTDPANQEVYKFTIALAFVDSPIPATECDGYINADGEFVGTTGCSGGLPGSPGSPGGGGTGPGGTGGAPTGWSCGSGGCSGPGVTVTGAIVDGHPLIEWLVLRGQAAVLKQFFQVTMLISNLSPEPFDLTDGTATLNLPAGLSLAPTTAAQSPTQPVGTVAGDSSTTVDWIIRGDIPGYYGLSAGYTGTLQPFGDPVTVNAELAEPLHIWGVEALGLSVQADSGALSAGTPYHVRVGVTNNADVPLYDVAVSIDPSVHDQFIFQPQEEYTETLGEIDPGDTVYTHAYILVPDSASASVFNPALSSATFDGQTPVAGSGIQAVAPPPLYTLDAALDTPALVHLHWQPVAGAQGYLVFSTPDLDTPFSDSPDLATEDAGGTPTTDPLPATATDAFLDAAGGSSRYYAVSTIIDGRPTLEHPVVPVDETMSNPILPAASPIIFGDSYMSGEGGGDYDPNTTTDINGCDRSGTSMGQKLGRALGFTEGALDMSCSGATDEDMLSVGQYPASAPLYGWQPQINDYDDSDASGLTFVGTGGDDNNFFSGIVQHCLGVSALNAIRAANPVDGPQQPCLDPTTVAGDAKYMHDTLFTSLVDTYSALRAHADPVGGEVWAATYPLLVDTQSSVCPPNVTIAFGRQDDRDMLNQLELYLNEVITNAARAAGVNLLDRSDAFADGHQFCGSGDVAVNGFALGLTHELGVLSVSGHTVVRIPLSKNSFHPNALGQTLMAQYAMARYGNVFGHVAPTPLSGTCRHVSNANPCPAPEDETDPQAEPPVIPLDLGGTSATERATEVTINALVAPHDDAIEAELRGLLPGSTTEAVLHSSPTDLGTFPVDANGDATITVPVPDTLGWHELDVTGTEADGTPATTARESRPPRRRTTTCTRTASVPYARIPRKSCRPSLQQSSATRPTASGTPATSS
jgi:flagellar hook assembly protein FlgD/PKD repeat protein